MTNKQAQVSVLMSLISSIVAYFHILRIRQTAGTCFALKSMLSRRRHRFQIVFAFTCGHQKRFTNGNVWTWINTDTCERGLHVVKIFFSRDLIADVMSVHNRNMKHAQAIEFD